MSKIDGRIEKYVHMINSIVNCYFIVDQNLRLLKPLLENVEVYSRWDNTYAVSGLRSIRLVLYMHILADMRAIMFDATNKKVASMKNIVNCLKCPDFIKPLKKRFCVPPVKSKIVCDSDFVAEAIIENDVKLKDKAFETMLDSVISDYASLAGSELAKRVINARNKMISHKEFAPFDGKRRIYEASDFELRIGDAEDVVAESKAIIFNAYSLLTKSRYDTDGVISHHEFVSKQFWCNSNANKARPVDC